MNVILVATALFVVPPIIICWIWWIIWRQFGTVPLLALVAISGAATGYLARHPDADHGKGMGLAALSFHWWAAALVVFATFAVAVGVARMSRHNFWLALAALAGALLGLALLVQIVFPGLTWRGLAGVFERQLHPLMPTTGTHHFGIRPSRRTRLPRMMRTISTTESRGRTR